MRRGFAPDFRMNLKDRKMDKVLIANIIIVVLEIIGFSVCRSRGFEMLIFYTQLSNLVTLISSVCLIISRGSALTVTLRYLSTVMLTMTVLITLAVLIPMGAGFANMMLSGMGLFHHTLCPLISITSYMLWERHSAMWGVPVAVTFVYGVAMLVLNNKGIVDGPYPFLRVRYQSVKATVIWMAALTMLITALSFGVTCIAK